MRPADALTDVVGVLGHVLLVTQAQQAGCHVELTLVFCQCFVTDVELQCNYTWIRGKNDTEPRALRSERPMGVNHTHCGGWAKVG